jgi:hypothetical protein
VTVPLEQQGAGCTPRTDALAYADFGLRVAPAGANGKLLVNPKQATCDPQIIRMFWSRWPHADIAWAAPKSIIVVTVSNRYRCLGWLGGGDACNVETASIATATGGACLLYTAGAGPYRALMSVGGLLVDVLGTIGSVGIEIFVGAPVLLPSAGTGRRWIRQLSETPPAPAPSWVEEASVVPVAERKTGALFQSAGSSWSPSHEPLIASAHTVARALGSRKAPHRGNYSCRCPGPSHRNGDRRPSLSVGNGDDGRLLLNCFGDCSYGEILEALRQRSILPRRRQ